MIKRIAKDVWKAEKPCNILLGEVKKASPLSVKISQKITIDKDFLYVTSKCSDLKAGDTVLLVMAEGGQMYAVIDKVV